MSLMVSHSKAMIWAFKLPGDVRFSGICCVTKEILLLSRTLWLTISFCLTLLLIIPIKDTSRYFWFLKLCNLVQQQFRFFGSLRIRPIYSYHLHVDAFGSFRRNKEVKQEQSQMLCGTSPFRIAMRTFTQQVEQWISSLDGNYPLNVIFFTFVKVSEE